MKKLLIRKMLLALALLGGANFDAWAYDVPDNYEIKNVLIGSESAGVVSPETFESTTIGTLTSNGWSQGSCASLAIYDISTNDAISTNYASGNTLRGTSSKGGDSSFDYSFSKVSSGKLVFNCDFIRSGSDKNDNMDIYFKDDDGYEVFYFGFATGNTPNTFQYSTNGGLSTNTSIQSNMRGNLQGYRVSDLVVDLETGDVSMSVTYINTSSTEQTQAVNFKIGKNKNIANINIHMRDRKSVNQAYNIDNISLYTVDYTEDAPVFSVVAKAGSTELMTIGSQIADNGKEFSVYLPRIIEKDGAFYQWSEYTSSTTSFKKTYTMGAVAETKEVSYTLDESIVGYSEIGNSGTDERYSGGGYTNETRKYAQTTVDAGVYYAEIYVAAKGGSGSNYRQQGFFVNDTEKDATTGNSTGIKTLKVRVTEDNTNLYVRGKGSSSYSDNLDYVIIRKVDLSSYEEAFNALKTYADALVAVESDNSSAKAILSSSITSQTSAVAASVTAEEITTATSTLKTAMNTYIAAANPTYGHQFDLTYLLTNPNLENITNNGSAAEQGWFTDIPTSDLGTYNNFQVRTNLNSGKNAVERYTSTACTTANTYGLYQKVTLPAGDFSFCANAFANRTTTIVMAAGSTEGDAVTSNDFTEYGVEFSQASESEVKVGIKISSSGTNTCYWMALTELKLYKEATCEVRYTAAKAVYDEKVENLDSDGQAYWNTNVTDPEDVTDMSLYNTAIAALPTTYIAAVKAQTTKGSDMTDAMPTGNAGWTCAQGNGPASYQSTGATETYSDGTNNAKFAAGNIMSQTISGLPNGYYKVQFYGVVNAANSVSTVSGSDLVEAYANSTNLDIDVVLQNSCTPTDYLRTIEAQVTDGSLTYGLKAKEGVDDAGNWAVAKIYKLTYLGADKNTYAINAVAGETTIKELATGAQWASETYGVYVPKVILYNSKYYVLDDEDNANLDGYYASYTMGASNETKEISYTLDESIKAFFEGESMSYVGHSFFGTLSNRSDASNGRAVTVYTSSNSGGAKTSSTISKDLYNISVAFVYWDDKTDRFILQYSTDNENWVNIATFDLAKNTNSVESANVLIPSASYLRLMNDMEQTPRHSIDYILVKKLNVNDDPVVVGDINNATAYLAAMTDKVTLKPGEKYHYEFVNHNSNGSDNSKNWILPVYLSGESEPTIALRADNWEDKGGNNTGCWLRSNGSDNVWDDFINQMNGATVDMTVEYTAANVLNIDCDITTSDGLSWKYTYSSDYEGSTRSLTGNIDIALSVSLSWAEILSERQSAVAATISDSGWNTFSSNYALDLSTITNGTAYVATSRGANTVKVTPCTAIVAAGTGLMIKGTAGETFTIGVTADAATLSETNLLVGLPNGGDVAAANYNYVFAWPTGYPSNYGFYYVNSSAASLGAGKAYLHAEGATPGARLTISFDDETTAITDVKGENESVKGSYYDMQGRKVANPTSGLYIVNGRKVIVK